MNKLSVVIIAKNAETVIADSIESVRGFASEVIVIDDGSTDHTVEIARLLEAKIYEHREKSFAEKRNFGLKKAKYKWIFYIDADERTTPDLVESIKKQVLGTNKIEFAAFAVKRKNFYLGKHEWPQIETHTRVFDRKFLKKWQGDLHETPVVDGAIGLLDGLLVHYTHQSLEAMIEKTVEWSEVEAKLRFKSGHPRMSSWRFLRVMMTAFYDSYFRQAGYKAGTAGLIESIYQSYSMFITYARLWEMQEKKFSK